MHTIWKKSAVIVSILALLLAASPAMIWADTQQPAAAKPNAQTLSKGIAAEVKSVLYERIFDGTRIGAVVRLYNNSTSVVRVPDYDIRITTADGVTYTLQPSTSNARSIQAKSKVELSYMLTVNRTDAFALSKLAWVDVNEEVYPKKETTVLSVNISKQVWNGPGSQITNSAAVKNWSDSFTIPVFNSPLTYTPVDFHQENAAQDIVCVVTMKVENPGKFKEFVPDFSLDAVSELKDYAGSRIEKGSIALEPGETKEIHFAIPADRDEVIQALQVVTPEMYTYTGPDGLPAAIRYTVGRIRIGLPEQTVSLDQMKAYAYDTPIAFDPLNKVVNKQVGVSLVELHMHENPDEGYQTAVAKFKLRNTGSLPIPVPEFQAQLISKQGYTYSGVRQTLSERNLMPNLSYVVSYSFAVPKSETNDTFEMKILDDQTAAPYSAAIAAYKVGLQSEADGSVMEFYPFSVKLSDWNLSSVFNSNGGGMYSYKLKLILDITRKDDVVVNNSFSKMKIELVDNLGRTLGSKDLSFTGTDRLISGDQTINFGNLQTDQLEFPVTIRIYEAIDTP
ncbi:hypothetical protein, partial [Ferviditalea candida]|nr:hypothetical protein [Paenibacillaceae bacterium T2]